VTRHSLSVTAVLFLLFPLNLLGQHGGRHATSGTNGGTTAQPEDPDAATFKRAVAEQATDGQIAQFHLMTKSTEAARQQALDLQHLNSNAAGSEDLSSKARGLQDSVEKALTDTRIFLQSFSDSQQANLKNLAKKLTKSGAAVNKSAKGLSQQLEQQTLNAGRLIRTAENVEKALAELQTDQLSLGKEMAVPSP
jgi:hypothetical protein